MPAPTVPRTADFDRISALPRRRLTKANAEAWAEVLSDSYREHGAPASVRLRPGQGVALAEIGEAGGGFLALPVGVGKALADDEPVLTPSGYVPIARLHVGDSVIGSSGAPVRVLGVYPQGTRETFVVRFSDGVSIRCDSDHLWTFRTPSGGTDSRRARWKTKTTREWSAEELFRPCGAHRAARIFAPMLLAPAEFLPTPSPRLDPYTLGALLGDGGMTQCTINFTSMDLDIIERLRMPPGIVLRKCASQNSGRATQYNIVKASGRVGPKFNALRDVLVDFGLAGSSSHTKFIPEQYLEGSVETRIELLRGLFDTDGSVCGRGAVELSTMSSRLAAGVQYIVNGLGGTCTSNVTGTGAIRMHVRLPLSITPFWCARKKGPYEGGAALAQRPPYRSVVAITRSAPCACTCIEVDSPDGLFAARDGVLTHNTLVSYLAPAVCECRRAMLVIPASLEEKTWADFASYRGLWKAPGCSWKIVTRERAYRDDTEAEITRYDPDIILIDEGDEMSGGSGGSRVLARVIKAREPIVVVLTGTPGRRSILDYWHQLIWIFGAGAPVPTSRGEAEVWAAALDQKGDAYGRPDPGPLGPTLEAARAWYLRRLAETPGVVILDGDSCDAPLTVRVRPALEDSVLDRHFEQFLVEQVNPGGMPVSDPLSRWLLDGQLGCGLYSYWDPPPPPEWASARRAACAFARDQIESSEHRGDRLDTEGKVFRRFAGHPVVAEWRRQKPLFRGSTKIAWVSDSTIRSALAWLAESDEPGIVWCGSVDFGRRLAERARLPYYGRLGKCETDPGRPGLHAVRGETSIVASWRANKKGFNLQSFGRQLLIFPPMSAKWLEQIFGRSHRAGREGSVTIDILATSGGTADAFDAAIAEARFGRETYGLTQKLLRATIERVEPRITPGNEFRWARKS